ncbi:hypothetical protein VHUM_03238 [Vanrija humicola]|uniref:Uncharacterized protein n=1 Tax=Vanrija humicola TaxID=5417 RepID=A0A7D8V005_VANHU|nr:hypothetical protein VHUM_03238 [Vanrija humicola]
MMAFSDMRSTWVDDEPAGARAALRHGFPAFNPQHMPLDYWHLIPSDYLWALNRAWDASGKDQASAHVCFDEFIEAAKGERQSVASALC